MAGKSPRAKVRLRLDKGTLLLRQFGITSITCSIIDLSEAGCQCHFSMEDMDEQTATAWKQILSPGRVLSVELTEPADLRNLIFREAQIRWVKASSGGNLDFGMLFSNVDDFQRDTLNQAMMSFASEKLRSNKKATEALTKTSRNPSLTAKAVVPDAAANAPAPAAPSTPASVQRSGPQRRGFDTRTPAHGTLRSGAQPRETSPAGSGSRTPAAGSGSRTPVTGITRRGATPAGGTKIIGEEGRQKRQNVYMSALFEFCGEDGVSWEQGVHQGRTVDFNEGGFKLEGPAPDCCDPEELIPREAYTNVVIRNASEEVKCRCRVRSAQPSTNMRGFWMYGVQIMAMEDKDRQQLREMYIRAGFTSIKRR